MRLIRDPRRLAPPYSGPCIATMGNFDGLHIGHREIIERLKARAAHYRLPSAVITFEPQPQEYFAPQNAPARLTRFGEKFEQLERQGIDRLFRFRFDRELAALPPEAFVRDLLVKNLRVHCLVVGDDFHFGRERRGNYATLEKLSRELGYHLEHVDTRTLAGDRISSSRIRHALARDDLELAARLLGRNYEISGRVAHGDKRGRALGFATANVPLRRMHSPLRGVYITRVHCVGRRSPPSPPLPALSSIGARPVFGGGGDLLETHVLDFDQDIYGRRLRVEFLNKLRPQRDYACVDDLRSAIAGDLENARRYFAETGEG